MDMEIPIGSLVRLMSQDIEDEWVSKVSLGDDVGVVIDYKIDSQWVSGHGPVKYELSLVSWDKGSVRWVYSDRLTTYGL
jgi:hypothetical protein